MTEQTQGRGKPLDVALLSVEQTYLADCMTVKAGIPGTTLMENAGAAVADAVIQRWSARPTVVLCGPGNNGGDGFVAARLLSIRGWSVRVALLGDPDRLTGDARHHAGLWRNDIEELTTDSVGDAELVIDALFGAGLTRPLDGVAAKLARQVKDYELPVVSIDVPSGLLGETGAPAGENCFEADLTVTFCRKKPGHLLQPGRALCGELVVADIGIPDSVIEQIAPRIWENSPAQWRDQLPKRDDSNHKYDFGHALIAGGGEMTGAGRLASLAALRVGAGLVTVSAPAGVALVYQLTSPSLIVALEGSTDDFARQLDDPRKSAILIGPGAGVTPETKARCLAALATRRATVLDADALTVFADAPARLFEAIEGPVVLTPHAGEFKRLFPGMSGSRLDQAKAAATESGATIVLKGSDTIVSKPDGRVAINGHASPNLATAGSGDVLAGLITGLLAQGMPDFEAACGGVWIQGDAALRLSAGMISEDLIGALPAVLESIKLI